MEQLIERGAARAGWLRAFDAALAADPAVVGDAWAAAGAPDVSQTLLHGLCAQLRDAEPPPADAAQQFTLGGVSPAAAADAGSGDAVPYDDMSGHAALQRALVGVAAALARGAGPAAFGARGADGRLRRGRSVILLPRSRSYGESL